MSAHADHSAATAAHRATCDHFASYKLALDAIVVDHFDASWYSCGFLYRYLAIVALSNVNFVGRAITAEDEIRENEAEEIEERYFPSIYFRTPFLELQKSIVETRFRHIAMIDRKSVV